MKKRQIPKNPHVPAITEAAAEKLTQLCFGEESSDEAEVLFLFGTAVGVEAQARAARELLSRYRYHRVVLTGGIPRYEGQSLLQEPEAELMHAMLSPHIPPETECVLETRSLHTLENITGALALCDLEQYNRVQFVAKSFALGRAGLTLARFLPHARLFSLGYDAAYPDERPIIRQSWHGTEEGRRRVWGEFLRIRAYGEQGHLAYPQEVRQTVEEIERCTHTR